MRGSVRLWIAAAVAVPLLVAMGLLLSAPFWIDASVVQSKIAQWAGGMSGGHARFARVELHYRPLPGLVLAEPAFSVPGMAEISAHTGAIDLDFLGLLRGRVLPRSVRLERPTVRITLPESGSGSTPLSLQQLQVQLRAIVGAIADAAPAGRVEVVDATLELRIGARATLRVDHLDIRFSVDGGVLELTLSGESDLWRRVEASMRLARDTLVGKGHLGVTGLQLGALGSVAGFGKGWPVEQAPTTVALDWQMRSLADVQAEVSASSPTLTLRDGDGRLDIRDAKLDATARVNNGAVAVTVRRAVLGSPAFAAEGSLAWSDTAGYRLEARAGDVNIPALLDAARSLAPGVEWLARPRARLEAGTLRSLQFGSRGATAGELLQPASMQVAADVAGIEIVVPEYDLRLRDAAATASLAGGELRVEHFGARLGQSNLRDGRFVTMLGAAPMPLQASLAIDANLSETLAIAKRVITDRGARRQMQRLKRLKGNAVVHVALAGDVTRVRPRIDVVALNAEVEHDAIAFPLRIAKGTAIYTDDALSAGGVDGSLGPVAFSGLGAVVELKPPYRVSGGQGSAVLAIEPLVRWARQQPAFEHRLEGLERATGTVTVTLAALEGPATRPLDLRFRASAVPHQVTVDAPALAPPVTVDGGTVAIDPRSIVVSHVRISALDGTLDVSGRTGEYRDGIHALDASVNGNAGLALPEWLHARAGLPESLRLRGAVTLSGVNAAWQSNGAVRARGNVTVTGGPVVGFTIARTLSRIDLTELTIRDEASDATVSGSLEGSRFDARFKGRLAGTSIAQVFADPPVALAELHGDLQLSGDWKNPGHGTGSGFLRGSDIRLPVRVPDPLNVEVLWVEAKDSLLTIKAATLAAGSNRVSFSGSVERSRGRFRVDADLHADLITLPVPAPAAAPAPPPDPEASVAEDRRSLRLLDDLPLSGEVRFDIRRLRRGSTEIAPLVGSAALETGHLDLRVRKASLCSIDLEGSAVATSTTMDLKVAARTRGARLEHSVDCLTDQRLAVTGALDLDVELAARGEPGTLLDRLQGRFSAVSRDGRIEKFEALSRIFDLLNVTEVVHGTLPDLKQKGMAYRSVRVAGRVAGRKVNVEEAVLDATGVKIAAQGSVDYASKKVHVSVLVAPLQTANRVLDKLPILGRIFGGTVLALPVQVSGTVDKPVVVPLGPRAVASRLVDIIANTLKLPADLVNTMSTEVQGKKGSPPAGPAARQR